MPEYKDTATRLREATKRIDLPTGIVPLMAEAYEEIVRLEDRVRDLEKRHLDASFMLADWDGYYNPDTKKGNTEELASLIEDAYRALQNKSWRDLDDDDLEENTND